MNTLRWAVKLNEHLAMGSEVKYILIANMTLCLFVSSYNHALNPSIFHTGCQIDMKLSIFHSNRDYKKQKSLLSCLFNPVKTSNHLQFVLNLR